MNTKTLTAIEKNILKEVLSKRRPYTLPLLDSLGSASLTDEQREELRGAIAEELIEAGLGPGDEPNQDGLLLESLIDRLGHL